MTSAFAALVSFGIDKCHPDYLLKEVTLHLTHHVCERDCPDHVQRTGVRAPLHTPKGQAWGGGSVGNILAGQL